VMWRVFSTASHGTSVGQSAEVVQDLSDTAPLAQRHEGRLTHDAA